MNESFKIFLSLPEHERRDAFEAAASRLGILPGYAEKDFWVCLVLDLLYNGLPEGHPQLFFKGGTSLSKAFDLVRRFSEDVDIVVRREDLGFTGDRDPTIPGSLSNNKRKTLFKELNVVCSTYVFKRLAPALEKLLGEIAEGCRIVRDESNDSEPTLLIEYPTLYGNGSYYVEPSVKIEIGAKEAPDPNLERKVVPFIAEERSDLSFDVNGIRVIAPERTYWEKLLILHGWHCGYRDQERLPGTKARISRHYSDVAMLTATELGESALSHVEMLDKVREHNLSAFKQAWKRIDEAVPGSLRLVPQPELLEVIEQDYENMRRMIFGGVPEIRWILEQIQRAEDTINRIAQ